MTAERKQKGEEDTKADGLFGRGPVQRSLTPAVEPENGRRAVGYQPPDTSSFWRTRSKSEAALCGVHLNVNVKRR